MERKAQGALEYLITYGWAILIIVIIGGALFALGVFNPASWVSNKRATGFASFQVKDWKITPLDVSFVLGNKLGDTMNLQGITITKAGETSPCFLSQTFDGFPGYTLNVDEQGKSLQNLLSLNASVSYDCACGTAPCGNVDVGKSYTLTVQFNYTTPTQVTHLDTGTITGKVES